MFNNLTYYSQNFEDVILSRCFANVTAGFYIDVGAQQEEADSVTRFFYERGWSGINIEPVVEFADTFSCRDRDTTICCAAGSKEVIAPMSVSVSSGLSTFRELAHARESTNNAFNQRNIQVRRLNSILEQLGIENKFFEFLKIDVEGSELDVLMGIDLFRYRPQIILCEVTKVNSMELVANIAEIYLKIESCNYEKVYFDGLNQWWCAIESITDLIQHFKLPPCIFDSVLISPYAGTMARKHIFEINQNLNSVNQELISVNQELISVNQKLISVNQGLTSVNQELTSVNQELTSANQELNSVTQELSKVLTSRTWRILKFLRFFKSANDKT